MPKTKKVSYNRNKWFRNGLQLPASADIFLYLRTRVLEIMHHLKFEIDESTFNDLEVFSERSGSKSIYHLFKNTRTLGARDLLMKIMKEPLSDLNALTDRRDAIKYFKDKEIKLEVSHNQVDMIEHYLTFNKRYLRDNPMDAVFDHFSNRINFTSHYYIILTGIKYFSFSFLTVFLSKHSE